MKRLRPTTVQLLGFSDWAGGWGLDWGQGGGGIRRTDVRKMAVGTGVRSSPQRTVVNSMASWKWVVEDARSGCSGRRSVRTPSVEHTAEADVR